MYRPTRRRAAVRHRARTAASVPAPPSPAPQIVLRRATEADLAATARLHAEHLPVGFFPALGPAFPRRWHRTFLRSPHAVALVGVYPGPTGEVVGAFLLGSLDEAAHMKALLANRRSLLVLALGATVSLAHRPALLLRFVRTRAWPWTKRLVRATRAEPAAGSADTAPVAMLSAVAVQPGLRGSGIGGHLVALFLARAGAHGATTAELVTATGPAGAAGFYERLGWSPVREHRTRDGEIVHSYRHPVVPPTPFGPTPTDAGPSHRCP